MKNRNILKNNSFILNLFVLFIGIISGVNPLFSQMLTTDKEEVEFFAGDGSIINGYIAIENETNDTLSIEWRVLESTVNNDWFIQFCDFEECATNEFGPLPSSRAGEIPPGYSDQWYLGVDLTGNTWSQALWQIEIEYFDSGLRDTLTWIVAKPSNVGDMDSYENNLSLYPNPASNLINIKNPDNRSLNYRILDVAGKELRTGIVTSDREPVNIDVLPSGMYFISVTDAQTGNKQLMKFIKQ